MKVSIIIGTMNHLDDLLKPCVQAIKKYVSLHDKEVIIVANGCTDGTREYVESLGKGFKLVWFDEAQGYAGANNAGILEAKGDYILLLNNDAFLLEQRPDTAINMLLEPFKNDPQMGITGPIYGHSEPAGRDFIVFFCAMIKREVFETIGLLDTSFGRGGGEDTDFCIKAEQAGFHLAKAGEYGEYRDGIQIGSVPIYHKGEATMHDFSDWQEVFDGNSRILAERYNHQWKLGNNCERAVFAKGDVIYPRERARYEWAAKHLVGKRVLEIGCSSGYGVQFLPADVDYTGIDYSGDVVSFAISNFGDDNHKFIHADINTFEFGEYDTIIAFEVLEHLERGKEIAQELKKHCKRLLCSTPYKEIPGLWGHHHVLHGLAESDFPDFSYQLVSEDGRMIEKAEREDGMNLMLMQWPTKERILCSISTKDRYFTTLPLAIQSVINQTHKPDKLVIFDDGEHIDLREYPLYRYLFAALDRRGIYWEILFSDGSGQHHNHQRANKMGYELVWRLDDDEVAEPDVLERLLSHMTDSVGAVAGSVVDPTGSGFLPMWGTTLLEALTHPNIQWEVGEGVYDVEHLYSSFLYRADVVDYDWRSSPVAHREETIFTHRLYHAGYRLLVDRSIRTWHYRNPDGGIRANSQPDMFLHDEQVFHSAMYDLGYRFIVMSHGLGDHYALKGVVTKLIEQGKKVVLFLTYAEVFEELGVPIYSIADAHRFGFPEVSVYQFMAENNWEGTLVEALEKLYLN